MRRFYIITIVTFLYGLSANAQCAMCRAQLESMEDNTVAEGINDGIVYLMLLPYILMAAVAYLIYRSLKQKKNKEQS